MYLTPRNHHTLMFIRRSKNLCQRHSGTEHDSRPIYIKTDLSVVLISKVRVSFNFSDQQIGPANAQRLSSASPSVDQPAR